MILSIISAIGIVLLLFDEKSIYKSLKNSFFFVFLVFFFLKNKQSYNHVFFNEASYQT